MEAIPVVVSAVAVVVSLYLQYLKKRPSHRSLPSFDVVSPLYRVLLPYRMSLLPRLRSRFTGLATQPCVPVAVGIVCVSRTAEVRARRAPPAVSCLNGRDSFAGFLSGETPIPRDTVRRTDGRLNWCVAKIFDRPKDGGTVCRRVAVRGRIHADRYPSIGIVLIPAINKNNSMMKLLSAALLVAGASAFAPQQHGGRAAMTLSAERSASMPFMNRPPLVSGCCC